MKTSFAIRFASLACALALFSLSPISLAQTVVGPGPVPAPLEIFGGNYRIVAGTQIMNTSVVSSNGGATLTGGLGGYTFSSTIDFEGGLIQGASVTTQAGVTTARAGHAFVLSSPSTTDLDFFDGTYRGGSIFLNNVPTNIFAGSAILTGGQTLTHMKIHGGLFEGGTVATAADPSTFISRAPAVEITTLNGGRADIFGGTFVGAIDLNSSKMRVVFHGMGLAVSPPPVLGYVPPNTNVMISGTYDDGTSFSTLVRAEKRLLVTPGTSTLTLQIPEPAAGLIAAACGIAVVPFRRRLRRFHQLS